MKTKLIPYKDDYALIVTKKELTDLGINPSHDFDIIFEQHVEHKQPDLFATKASTVLKKYSKLLKQLADK